MRAWVLVAALAACGGSKAATPKQPVTPIVAAPPANECQAIGTRVADTVMSMKDPPKLDKATVADVIRKHCETDNWSAEAKKCLATMTEATADECGGKLDDAQSDKLMQDLLAHLPKDTTSDGGTGDDGGGEPTSDGDPCEGGE